jgi:hypothetical protein
MGRGVRNDIRQVPGSPEAHGEGCPERWVAAQRQPRNRPRQRRAGLEAEQRPARALEQDAWSPAATVARPLFVQVPGVPGAAPEPRGQVITRSGGAAASEAWSAAGGRQPRAVTERQATRPFSAAYRPRSHPFIHPSVFYPPIFPFIQVSVHPRQDQHMCQTPLPDSGQSVYLTLFGPNSTFSSGWRGMHPKTFIIVVGLLLSDRLTLPLLKSAHILHPTPTHDPVPGGCEVSSAWSFLQPDGV